MRDFHGSGPALNRQTPAPKLPSVFSASSSHAAEGSEISATTARYIAASHSTVKRRRQDAPIAVPSKRGCKGDALKIDTNSSASTAYTRDKTAASSVGPRESLLRTWNDIHFACFSDTVPVLPLTVEKIAAVACRFKAGGYRSFPNYMSRMKSMHIEIGYDWSAQLQHEEKAAIRSVLRGIGPARQTAEMGLDAVHGLKLGDECIVAGGPMAPGRLFDVASFFLLREIEASLALLSHVTLNQTSKVITLRLPVSKTDPRALGCTRSWGCVCDDDMTVPCPYHAVLSQRLLLRDMCNRLKLHENEIPLFPSAIGEVVQKRMVVDTVESVASRLGLSVFNEAGDRLFGGHIFRIVGARRLASIGIEEHVICLLARWSSSVVLRYIKEAPLTQVTTQYKEKAAAHGEDKLSLGLRIDTVLQMVRQLAEGHEKQNLELASLQKSVLGSAYVVNKASGIWHACTGQLPDHPSLWSTACGWKYASSFFARENILHESVPWHQICERCLPCVRRQRQHDVVSTD